MNNKTRLLVLDAICLALLIISSKLSFPVTPAVKFTMQVLVVFTIALLLPLGHSLTVNVAYLFLGLILQLPVFSNGGGFTYIYSPTFGFIMGFFVSTIVIRLLYVFLQKHLKYDLASSIIATIAGLIVLYIFGVLYAYIVYINQDTYKTIAQILPLFVIPFIPFDLIKCVVASIINNRIKALNLRYLNNKNKEN